MRFGKNEPTVLVIELIRSHIKYEGIKLKPDVGLAAIVARYIVRCAAYMLMKILAKEERSVCTSAVGKLLKGGEEEIFRITLHNRTAEQFDQSVKLMAIVIHYETGDVFVTSSYAIRRSGLQKVCDVNDPLVKNIFE